MRRIHLLTLCCSVSLTLSSFAAQGQEAAPPRHNASVVSAARMLDVRSGRMLENVHVLIEDGRIKQVAHGKDAFILTTDMPRYDLGDATLLPGLIDMHVHIDSDPTYSGYSYLQFNDRFWSAVAATRLCCCSSTRPRRLLRLSSRAAISSRLGRKAVSA